jgi:hypothetical protein
MNEEFHYYAIRYLADAAGLAPDTAALVALSSARVDRALSSWEILDFPGGRLTERTQDYSFWSEDTARGIYVPFHFIPGDRQRAAADRRGDGGNGSLSPYIVTEDGPLAKELLVGALRGGNPWRIGIALHAYADTWAHQNFSGRLEAENDLGVGLPPAGHLQALRAPDEATGAWEDPRLRPGLGRVRNSERFLGAARKIYRYLRTWNRSSFGDEEEVLGRLALLWGGASGDGEGRKASFVVDLGVEPPDYRAWLDEAGIPEGEADVRSSGYERLAWLRAEIGPGGRKPRPLDTGGRYAGSALRRWDEAAREHREAVGEILRREGLLEGLGG